MRKSEHTQIITPARLFLQENKKELVIRDKRYPTKPVIENFVLTIASILDGTLDRNITLIKSYNCKGSEDSDDYKFIIIDGVYRLAAIKCFMYDKIQLSSKCKHYSFDKLSKTQQQQIENFRFNATLYTEFNDEKLTDSELVEIRNYTL